jgi:NAD+ diphosphatase
VKGLTGLKAAESRLGCPVRRETIDHAPPTSREERYPLGKNRKGEIVMVFPRPGGVLLHTKTFYPAGVLRLPSGGLHDGEAILAAAKREAWEETGMRLRPERFLFHILHRYGKGQQPESFHSFGLLYPFTKAAVIPQDLDEEISEFQEWPWSKLPEIVRLLESLGTEWRAWGRFRAAPHRILHEIFLSQPDWFARREQGDR